MLIESQTRLSIPAIDSEEGAGSQCWHRRLTIPADDMDQVEEWLALREALPGFAEGEVIYGYRTTYRDAMVAVIALCNSRYGPWLDPYMIWAKKYTGVPPSLPPTRDLVAPFNFILPDGSERIIELVRTS
jgi:hypothetical protein